MNRKTASRTTASNMNIVIWARFIVRKLWFRSSRGDRSALYDVFIEACFDFGWKETENATFVHALRKVIVDPDVEPRRWSHSPAYINTTQNATYNTSRSDIGAHNVTVYACDEFLPLTFNPLTWPDTNAWPDSIIRPAKDVESIFRNIEINPLCDWQTIRIFVFDAPLLNFTVSNLFDDIPNDFASIEDPFLLDGRGTSFVFTNFSELVWTDSVEPFRIVKEFDPENPGDEFVLLPDGGFDIISIKGVPRTPWTTDEKVFVQTGMHQINFTVNVATAPKISRNVNVMDCLPHRNPYNPYPFPYQNQQFLGDDVWTTGPDAVYYLTESDYYQAGHLCCDDGGIFYYDIPSESIDKRYVIEHSLGFLVAAADVDVFDIDGTPVSATVTVEEHVWRVFDFDTDDVLYGTAAQDKCNNVYLGGKLRADEILTECEGNVVDIRLDGISDYPVRVKISRTDAEPNRWGKTVTEGDSVVCYREASTFGGIFAVGEDLEAQFGLLPWPDSTETIGQNKLSPDDQNNVLVITPQRICGGPVPRGNICAGPFQGAVTPTGGLECEDMIVANQVESCQGAYNTTGGTPEEVDCKLYDIGESWESEFGLPSRGAGDATGACVRDAACKDGDFLSKGTGCDNGRCDTTLWHEPNPSSRGAKDKCSSWNGRAVPWDFDSAWACDTGGPVDDPDGDSIFTGPSYNCPANDDACNPSTGNLADLKILGTDNRRDFFDSCPTVPGTAFLEAGEDGVGGYCNNFPDADDTSCTSEGRLRICGDQLYEVIGENRNAQRVCCDGRDEDGDSLGLECVDSSARCTNTAYPVILIREGLEASTSLCRDGLDNDCNGFADSMEVKCKNQRDLNNKVICAGDDNVCSDWADSNIGGPVEGFTCLDDDLDFFLVGEATEGTCECEMPSSLDLDSTFCLPGVPTATIVRSVVTVNGISGGGLLSAVGGSLPARISAARGGTPITFRIHADKGAYPSGSCGFITVAPDGGQLEFTQPTGKSCILTIEII